jgi:L-histidine Nalpha-methyltransferase
MGPARTLRTRPNGDIVTGPELVVENLLPPDFLAEALRADARRGLTSQPKWLPPKWFYDEHGSALFGDITRLPEYYPTRAEREILGTRAGDIAALSAADTLVELGSGSSEKTRVLLDALCQHGRLDRYVPVDVSEGALLEAAEAVRAEYAELSVHALVADFTHQLDRVPSSGRRMVAFLGGTIGNFVPADRAQFLTELRATLEPGDTLLLGTDLVKSPDLLVPAYDDSAGVTAAFNRNVLHVLNRELKADFDPDSFDHVALWDAEQEWIEMRLRSRTAQTFHVAALDLDVRFDEGEELRTEVSAKFRPEGVEEELAGANFGLTAWWTDAAGLFALSLSTAE